MIAYLNGKVLYRFSDELCISSGGIGWSVKLFDPNRFEIGATVDLFIHTHFRENDLTLWGFGTQEELRFFKILLAVSGVGPRTAQTLIGSKGLSSIINAVKMNNPAELKVSGVGTKTAQKIILEIRDKIDAFYESDTLETGDETLGRSDIGVYNELRSALEALGYSHNDINKFIIKKREGAAEDKLEDLIRAFLKSA